MPFMILTICFVVGCLIFTDIDLWVPLTLFGVCGALFVWRGWSVALLALAVMAGGVRVSICENPHTSQSHAQESIFTKSNDWAQSQIDDLQLSPRSRGLASAMILGNREQITYNQRRSYGVSGASHILAVSGLHISIIVVLLNVLFRPVVLLPRGNVILSILMIVFIWGYGCVVGLSASVVRSVVMFSVLQLVWAFGSSYDGMNGLCLAVFGCVVVSPAILHSVGFQLSVLAVASIFLWGLPLYRRFFGGGGFLVSMLSISLCCSVATMPIVSHVFGYIPILGILFSPLFIFCTTAIIAVGSAWIIFPLGIFAAPLRLIVESAVMILEGSVEWVSRQGWGYVEWRASTLQLILIYLIYIVITLLVWSKENRENE